MPLALLYNRKDVGQGSRDLQNALAGTSYVYEGGCTQLLIRLQNVDIHPYATVGILAAHVRTTSDTPTPIPPRVLVDQNAILAVLPNCSLPSGLEVPIDLLDCGWFAHRREILECILASTYLYAAASNSRLAKKHTGIVQYLVRRKLSSWDDWNQCKYCFWWIEHPHPAVCPWCTKYLQEENPAYGPYHHWCRLQVITRFLRTTLRRRPFVKVETLYQAVAIFLA